MDTDIRSDNRNSMDIANLGVSIVTLLEIPLCKFLPRLNNQLHRSDQGHSVEHNPERHHHNLLHKTFQRSNHFCSMLPLLLT